MKTARFSKIVEKSGHPEIHLALVEPAKDRELQKAVKAQRVMTVLQVSAGTKADHGVVGFESGTKRQFLIFPKSLRPFAGRNVVGIQYDLVVSREVPKKDRAVPPRPPKPQPKAKTKRPSSRKMFEVPASPKVVPFHPAARKEEPEEVAELKKRMRHAMDLLEDGKAVAAFNLLKRAVGD